MLKDKVELFLNAYASNHPDVTVTAAKKNTGVYKNGIYQMYIYYRSDAIRVSVKPGTTQHGEYASLLRDHLVYQKDSANPYEPNTFAFFVDENDIATVLQRLLESHTLPTNEQMAEFAAHAQQYKENKHQRQMESERTVPVGQISNQNTAASAPNTEGTPSPHNAPQQGGSIHHSEDNRQIEKKLDSLIGAIATMYSGKSTAAEPEKPQEEKQDRRFRLEPTQGNVPVLMLRKPTSITGLIFTLRLYGIGLDDNLEQYRVFFTNSRGEQLSEDQAIEVTAGG